MDLSIECFCKCNIDTDLVRLFYKKLKNVSVSTTVRMVETQLCKLRGTSDTLDVLILYFIRAKRVSKCYIQEKKNCPSVCVWMFDVSWF